MFETSDKFLQNVINNWEICKFTRGVYDNAINEVIDSLSASVNDKSRVKAANNSSTPAQPHNEPGNYKFENEAVLMAIERKGLRQQSVSCDCPADEILEANEDSTPSVTNGSKLHNYVRNTEFDCVAEDEATESYFENCFMRTAVSAAIEQKGLGICRV